MQTAAKINLVLTDSSSLKRFADSETTISYGGFYQLIASGLATGVHKRQVFRELGDRLVMLAEQAFMHKRWSQSSAARMEITLVRLLS